MMAPRQLPHLSALAGHRLFPIGASLAAMLVYLGIAWWLLPAQALWSPDEGAKLMQLQALRLEQGRLAIDIPYPGRDLDPDLQFAPVVPAALALLQNRGGHLFFERLPLFPLLTKSFFNWLGFDGLYLLPAVAGAAAGMLTLLLLARSERRLTMWLLVAWGSPILVYSCLFWEHTLATGFGLGAAALAVWACSARSGSRQVLLAWLCAGMLLGVSVYLRLELALFGIALLVACGAVVRASRAGVVVAGIVLLGSLALYVPLHQALFGQSVPHNAEYLFYPFLYLARAGWRAVPDLLIGPAEEEAIQTGWLGVAWAAAAVVALIFSFDGWRPGLARRVQWLALAVTIVAASVFLFTPQAYRSAHGLLFTTPWAIVGVCRAREIWQRGTLRLRIVALTVVIGLIGYMVGLVGFRAASPQGGLEWGARFAMTFYPLLAILTGWEEAARPPVFASRLMTGILVVLGMGFQVRGLQTVRHDKLIGAQLQQALLAAPEADVVSDLWWLPLDAAPLTQQKTFFVALTPGRVKDWIELAAAHEVHNFLMVTLNADLFGGAYSSESYSLRVMETRQVDNLMVGRFAIQPP